MKSNTRLTEQVNHILAVISCRLEAIDNCNMGSFIYDRDQLLQRRKRVLDYFNQHVIGFCVSIIG